MTVRLGGPVFVKDHDPDVWVAAVRAAGYRAAYCPVGVDADQAVVEAYARAATTADIVIAEVGAWSNPISTEQSEQRAALDQCCAGLDLADRVGACCCVNIAGSRASRWDGPAAENMSESTFELIVETVRDIIDTVKPRRTYFALETMPYMLPDSVESYLQLVRAIDRERFAVHLDPVNLINCPRRYFDNSLLVNQCFDVLGPWIKSCHAKDVRMGDGFPVQLDEVRPGLGSLDYATFLTRVDALPAVVPVMLEHLPNQDEYRLAAEYVRAVAERVEVQL